MMNAHFFLPVLTALAVFTSGLQAQDLTARHRAVYEEVNAKAASWQKIKAEHHDDPIVFELEGWTDVAGLRKIISRVPGEDGDGLEEYYLDGGKLLFVYRTYQMGGGDGKGSAKRVEDRFYFKDGVLFQWLDSAKKVREKDADFTAEAERLTANFKDFTAALEKVSGASGAGMAKPKPKAAPGALQVLEGKFTGIEQGDYAHWQMTGKDGTPRSFFVLKPDKSVADVLDAPDKFAGRACRIQWKAGKETLPEAGGAMMVDQVVSVEWIK